MAVAAAVGICAGALVIVRPWREDIGASVQPISEKAARLQPEPFSEPPPAQPPALAVPKPAAPKPDLAKPEPPAAAPSPATTTASPAPAAAEKGSNLALNTPAPSSPSAPPAAAPTPVNPAPLVMGGNEQGPDTTAALPGSARLTKAEADEALKPLLEYSVSDSDVAALKEFVRRVRREEYSAAKPYLEKIKDPAARKLALWYSYKSGVSDASAEEIYAFRADNPLWPNRDTLLERSEEALFWRESDPKKVLAFFRDKRPVSAVGRAALGGAYMSAGRAEEGRNLLRQAWREAALTPAIESRIKDKYGSELRPADHKARIDWLVAQDSKSYIGAIERLLPLIDNKWEPQVKACIAAIKRAKNASTLIAKLDKEARDQPVVRLVRIQIARRADKEKEAWQLLSTPLPKDAVIEPLRWWAERESQIRIALNEGEAQTAYAIAKYHPDDLPPEDISDAEFLAGWIAFRFVNQPKAAREHFAASAAAGGLPFRRARAAYWAGRTEMQLGNAKAAAAFFAEGAQFRHTFYGQLSHQMIEPQEAKVAFRTYVRPTAQEIKAFNKLEVMRAIVIAGKADMDGIIPIFLFDLSRNIIGAPDMILAAEFSQRIARPNIAVRMAKIAMNRGFPVEHYAYPDALPQFKALTKDQDDDLERALIYALTRQESEFHTGTVSSAGAVGLMQLLPSTAKEVAKNVSVKFEAKKLTSDPSYNVSLGSAFLLRLLNSYDGNYAMTLAAYNAGPGRVRQWVEAFGDPRDAKVDPIDWIERIPFTETREYVHKIMESVQVYRTRLDKRPAALRLAQDLHRGRKDKPRFLIRTGN